MHEIYYILCLKVIVASLEKIKSFFCKSLKNWTETVTGRACFPKSTFRTKVFERNKNYQKFFRQRTQSEWKNNLFSKNKKLIETTFGLVTTFFIFNLFFDILLGKFISWQIFLQKTWTFDCLWKNKLAFFWHLHYVYSKVKKEFRRKN